MIVINTVSNERFSLNGIEYLKNFLSFVYGDKVGIYNAYDKTDERISLDIFSNFTVNGVVYGSAALLQAALLNVIYTRDTLGSVVNGLKGSITPTDTPAGTGTAYWFATQNGTYTNFGGVVVNTNSFAVISRNDVGAFSISQTAFDITSKVNVSDVINTLGSSETAKPLSAAQGKVLDDKNERQSIINESVINNSIDVSEQKLVYRNVIEPIINYTHQDAGVWSKFGFWSYMTAKSDYYADKIGVHLYSLATLTGNLRVKIFVNNVLYSDLTVLNANLVNTTIQNQIQYIELGKRIAFKNGDVVAIGWEMSNTQQIQLVHNSLAVDSTKNFGLNQNIDNAADGSIISATTPPAVPSSGDWYLPVHFFAKSVKDTIDQDLKNKLLEKSGGQVPIYDFRINSTTKDVWADGIGLETNSKSIWLIGYEQKIINAVYPVIVRGLTNDNVGGAIAGTFFTDSVIVTVALNDKWIIEKEITLAELIAGGANSSRKYSTTGSSMRFKVEIPTIEIKVGDVLFVNWKTKNSADKMSFAFTNTLEKEWATAYSTGNNVAFSLESLPPIPVVDNGWQMVVDCAYLDYVAKKIQDGGVNKETITNVAPSKIYTVCNDIATGTDGFESRNYSSCLYVDHFLKLTDKKEINFASTNTDKLPLFAPIATDGSSYNGGVNVKTTTVTDILIGKTINDIDVSISHISTKASLSAAQFPKILVIGDSVTDAFLAYTPLETITNNPRAYWAFVKKFFQLDRVDNGNTGHKALMIGKQSQNTFNVNGVSTKAFAEGRGGWAATNYLGDSSFAGFTNYFYDVAKPTANKFSLAKYLANYKTLADDGETRLVLGSTAGTLVSDVNAHDVCTPTHVVIQLGFNDVEANAIANIQLMIDSIKAEFPTMIIIVSSIDAAGTYFPEKYPMFNGSSINMIGDDLHSKMYNLNAGFKAMENVGSKIFYCPNYFIQPTAWGVPFRNVDFPENTINGQFIFKTEHGAGANYHPNNYAHAAWGYQLYSLIKYTLTL